jgi:DNA-binding transcriptional LysR family regulator
MIAQLEKRLGVRLLTRTTHRVSPTEAGQSFYLHARRTLEEADEAERAARGAGAALTGRLRIGVAVTFGSLYVIPLLPAFMALHPGLEIEVAMDDKNVDLVGHGLDVALRLGSLSSSTLTARKIGESRRLVLGTPEYFARAGEPLTPADLAAHQAIILDLRSHGTVWNFNRGNTQASVTVNGRLRVNAAEGLRAAVLAGMGLTMASEWLFARELRHRIVRPALLDWSLPAMDLWAVFPSGRRPNAKVRAFITFMDAELHPNGMK